MELDRRTNSKTAGGGSAPTVTVPIDRPAPAVTSKAGSQWVLRTNQHTDDGEMYEKPVDEPAPSVTTRGDNWKLTQKATGQKGSRSRSRSRGVDEPSLPVALGHNATAWCWEMPATTVVGSFQPDVIPPHGHRDYGPDGPDGPSRQDAPGAIRVELHELAALQDFPDGWPFQGGKTSVARQIGNAFPASACEAIIRALTDG